jgi:hypothetical protein
VVPLALARVRTTITINGALAYVGRRNLDAIVNTQDVGLVEMYSAGAYADSVRGEDGCRCDRDLNLRASEADDRIHARARRQT